MCGLVWEHTEEKDVLRYRIELSGPMSPLEYLHWTEKDLSTVQHDPTNPFFPGTPVYRIRYSFFEGKQHLASVYYEREEERIGPSGLRHQRTLVHPYDSGGRR